MSLKNIVIPTDIPNELIISVLEAAGFTAAVTWERRSDANRAPQDKFISVSNGRHTFKTKIEYPTWTTCEGGYNLAIPHELLKFMGYVQSKFKNLDRK